MSDGLWVWMREKDACQDGEHVFVRKDLAGDCSLIVRLNHRHRLGQYRIVQAFSFHLV